MRIPSIFSCNTVHCKVRIPRPLLIGSSSRDDFLYQNGLLRRRTRKYRTKENLSRVVVRCMCRWHLIRSLVAAPNLRICLSRQFCPSYGRLMSELCNRVYALCYPRITKRPCSSSTTKWGNVPSASCTWTGEKKSVDRGSTTHNDRSHLHTRYQQPHRAVPFTGQGNDHIICLILLH